jgi:hypothetical protein|tara:strand:- start:66 stop:377 length:312 start_codon:yes stop_codon:yes gene_type:complete
MTMAVRGVTVSGKAYTTSQTDILEGQCPHTAKRGAVFFVFATTAGTAKVHYKDPGGTFRELESQAVAANDLTAIAFGFPISEFKLTYVGTSSGGTINAEGRGF